MVKISPARRAAFDVLLRIERDRAFSSVLLPRYEDRLSQADRALCHELVLGVLRRAMFLDRLIETADKGKKLDLEVRIALRLGLFQLLYLARIPAHAAVNDSVNLVVRAKKSSARGFVNAILRKANELPSTLSFSSEIDRISVETSHPAWLVKKWSRDFGSETAEKIARANNTRPEITFRKTLKGRDLVLSDKYDKSNNVDGCFSAENFDPELRRLADESLVYFQDEASQMVAATVEVPSVGRFLDACAAPGGKTAGIAARAFTDDLEHAALIVAGDVSHKRTVFLKDNCGRQGVDFVNVLEYDAAAGLPFEDRTFDSILVDAPCSGTGTIRHNPEIRYFVEPADFAALQKTQLAILKNASKLLKLGGELIYSTCSLEKEENDAVCGQFLAENTDFAAVRPRVPDKFLNGDGFARTFPFEGMDGFFVARFRRLDAGHLKLA
jgi:16S rRNA (cytosine967-C5)-methyltransferase